MVLLNLKGHARKEQSEERGKPGTTACAEKPMLAVLLQTLLTHPPNWGNSQYFLHKWSNLAAHDPFGIVDVSANVQGKGTFAFSYFA